MTAVKSKRTARMKKKIYLIHPTYRDREGLLLKGKSVFIWALSLPALSAAVPPDWEKQYCLEFFEDVDYDTDASVIGISSMGYDIIHGREIAGTFKKMGKTVLFGGYPAHFLGRLIRDSCDSVIHGNPGPEDMMRILEDAKAGRLSPDYHCGVHIQFPFDYSVLEGKRIRFMPVVSSVGCLNRCEFCSTAALYRGSFRLRRIDHVLTDLKAAARRSKYAGFVDSNIYNSRSYTLLLCKRILDEWISLRWGAQSTVDVGDDGEVLKALRRAGCRVLYIGMETLGQGNLDDMDKRYSAGRYLEQIRRIHGEGIQVAGFFIVGLDGDDRSSFDRLFEFIHRSEIAIPILNILIPAPGTGTHDRLRRESRLLVKDEEDFLENNPMYNVSCNRCFYIPKQMSAGEVEDGYLNLVRRLSSVGEILRRSAARNPLTAASLLVMNLDIRKKCRAMETARYAVRPHCPDG
jgi:hypothetical protein